MKLISHFLTDLRIYWGKITSKSLLRLMSVNGVWYLRVLIWTKLIKIFSDVWRDFIALN